MPHGWIKGIKRIPLHLGGFGVPFGLATHFLPPPWNLVVLGGLAAWRAVAEWRDYKGKRDTSAKAGIDYASQVAGAVAGVLIH